MTKKLRYTAMLQRAARVKLYLINHRQCTPVHEQQPKKAA